MLSMESRIPPRPGIMEPESLQFEERFKTDSTRSPKMEVIEIRIPKKTRFKTEPVKTLTQYVGANITRYDLGDTDCFVELTNHSMFCLRK